PDMPTASLNISGMNCASCVAHVTKAARSVAGVQDCRVNLANGRATVEFDSKQTSPDKIASEITSAGYPTEIESSGNAGQATQNDRQKQDADAWLRRAIVGLALWLPVEIAHWILQWRFPHAHAAHAAMTW